MVALYEIELKVPLGIRHGMMTLKTDGESVNGYMEIMGSKTGFTGTLKEDRIAVTGTIKTLVRLIEYEGKGELQNGQIHMQLQDKKRSYMLTGKLKTEEM